MIFVVDNFALLGVFLSASFALTCAGVRLLRKGPR